MEFFSDRLRQFFSASSSSSSLAVNVKKKLNHSFLDFVCCYCSNYYDPLVFCFVLFHLILLSLSYFDNLDFIEFHFIFFEVKWPNMVIVIFCTHKLYLLFIYYDQWTWIFFLDICIFFYCSIDCRCCSLNARHTYELFLWLRGPSLFVHLLRLFFRVFLARTNTSWLAKLYIPIFVCYQILSNKQTNSF